MLEIAALHIYPVKSCAGIALIQSELDARGLVGDRGWMVVDEDGRFLTQRHHPRLALVQTTLDDEALRLAVPGREPLSIPTAHQPGVVRIVQVWDDLCEAIDQGDAAAQFFSTWLDHPAWLVRMRQGFERRVDPFYTRTPAITAFSDGYPLLLISEASLEDLNTRLEMPLPMNRFRPNLVVRGCGAYAEDKWRRLRIGEVVLDVVKPCSRCTIPTTDQVTGERSVEPLRTLATYRRVGRQVFFGQNVIHRGRGTLTVGDTVEVLTSVQ